MNNFSFSALLWLFGGFFYDIWLCFQRSGGMLGG